MFPDNNINRIENRESIEMESFEASNQFLSRIDNIISQIVQEKFNDGTNASPSLTQRNINPSEGKLEMPEEGRNSQNAIRNQCRARLTSLMQESFPFSRLSDSVIKEVLSIQLENNTDIHTDVVINQMLKAHIANKTLVVGSQTWHEIEHLVGNLDINALGCSLAESYKACKKNNDPTCGYCFHALLKMILKDNYELPDPSKCGSDTIDAEMGANLTKINFSHVSDPTRLIELILCRQGGNFLFLNHVDMSKFIPFAIDTICSIPHEQWNNKDEVITTLFEMTKPEFRESLASALANSHHNKTKKIGELFYHAFKAETPTEKYPYFIEICKLMPHVNSYNLKEIFNCSFPPFEKYGFKISDKLITLNFNSIFKKKVMTYGNMIIGFHSEKSDSTTSSLLAYNKNDKQLKWSIPLEKEFLSCDLTSQGIALVYSGKPELQIYNPETGEKIREITLPAIPGAIYLASNGFCYFQALEKGESVLYGGQTTNGAWEQAFRIKNTFGAFEPFGNYLYLKPPFFLPQQHTIVSQNGNIQTFDCEQLFIKNDKLYILKPLSPEKGSKQKIVMQSIGNGPIFQLRGEERTFILDNSNFQLEGVCDDDTVVGLTPSQYGEKIYYFIDMKKNLLKEIRGPFNDFAQQYIDSKSTTIWDCNVHSKSLWKHTKEASTQIDTHNTYPGTLVHVDENENLYFV